MSKFQCFPGYSKTSRLQIKLIFIKKTLMPTQLVGYYSSVGEVSLGQKWILTLEE